jgi:hypothetical protein
LEPETPPDPPPLTRVAPPEPPKSRKSKANDEPRNPNMIYQDEYQVLQQIFAALDEVDPQLRWRVAQALKASKEKANTPRAA